MKTLNLIKKIAFVFAIAALSMNAFSQQIDNWRAYDQDGVNVFEAPKEAATPFDGVRVKVGGSFAQQYQNLSHENDTSTGALYAMQGGFNLATANLNLDVQLAPGIRLALENYMSARHHTEFWVKGGYIQIDQLPMFDNPQWFTDMCRVKVGHFQPNYGDQMMRRTDNGNAMYNPFVGNYIMDAFTTEIGGEFYVFPAEGAMFMLGMTNGLIKGNVAEYKDGKETKPSIYFKGAFDKQLNDDTRFRLAASFMTNGNSGRNTLMGGDRAGSRFYGVMEEEGANLTSKAQSGRWNPRFTNQITATQINAFLKAQGLEFFGTYEMASGNNLVKDGEKYKFEDDNKRSVSQISAEVLYRFLENEAAYVAGRYNMMSGELSDGYKKDDKFVESSISRMEFGAGWFATKNLLLKVMYVKQNYNDFVETAIYRDGMFSGFMIEAVAGF